MNMELFHFDIETVGEYKDYDTFLLNDERGAKLFEGKWKRMKWDEKFSLEDSYIDQAGIISTYGRICCISFGYVDSNGQKQIRSFYGEDERLIVENFNDLLKKIEKKSFNLSGFRINYFDIPWVLHKLHKYEITPADMIRPYEKKPWEMRIVDMADDWKQKFAYTYSFDEMCYELGVASPKTKMDGSLVHEYYHTGRIEEIKEYCEMDVSSSIDAGLKLYK
jgi:predicted PolB exonuclease-like 3'-5' exonuclease